MLVLSRKKGESIMIGDSIELVVVGVEGDVVKIGVNAPKHIEVHRKEIYVAIQQSNREAVQGNVSPEQLSEMFKNLGKN